MKQPLIAALLVLLSFLSSSSPGGEPPLPLWGYMLHTSSLTNAYLKRAVPQHAVISHTGFILTDSGEISISRTRLTEMVRRLAIQSDTAVYPLVTFRSPAQGRRILGSDRTRKAAAVALSAMAKDNAYRGVNLDFEYLPPGDSEKLARFLSELRHRYQGKITMAIFPQVGFPEKWSRFHDLGTIAHLIDEAVIMCYDYHGTHSGPGPVTDISWAEENIRHALRFMKPERLWLGIPAYGYLWCGGKAEAVSAKRGVRLARSHGAVRHSSGNLHAVFARGGAPCTLYLSDSTTRSRLTALARRYRLAGTATWRLGLED